MVNIKIWLYICIFIHIIHIERAVLTRKSLIVRASFINSGIQAIDVNDADSMGYGYENRWEN